MHLVRTVSLSLGLLAGSHAARAMQFTYVAAEAPAAAGLLTATGKVQLGDEERLRGALHAVPATTAPPRLVLESLGGDLEEGFRLATAVREIGLQTVVGEGAHCASACVIVFAAGSHRFASTSALVGVHSASYGGSDTEYAQAATVRMARRLSEYGVPDAILGKMVSAKPSQIWWLNRADLESMRVDMHVPQFTAAAPAPAASSAAAAAVATAKSSFHVEPVKPGFQVSPPASGFHVWQPGSAG